MLRKSARKLHAIICIAQKGSCSLSALSADAKAMVINMPNIEVLNDQPYFEPNTVRISVHSNMHHGKFWQHTHEFYELVYVIDGFTLHSYNGSTSVLTGGDLFAIPPGNVHSYTAAYHARIFNILFYLDELDFAKDELIKLSGIEWEPSNQKSAHLPIVHIALGKRRELTELCIEMIREREEKRSGWELKLRMMLISFLIMYSRLISEKCRTAGESGIDNRGYSGYIYSALKFVEDNYRKDIASADIAGAAGVSADYLAKQFKAVMSLTPTEYVRKYRIAKSMNLLRDTDMSIAEISAATGFKDAGIFSRVFKQTIGTPPATFRKE